MKTIRAVCHRETEKNWWADSPDLHGYFAGAETFEELKALVNEGIPFALGEPARAIDVIIEAPPAKSA